MLIFKLIKGLFIVKKHKIVWIFDIKILLFCKI